MDVNKIGGYSTHNTDIKTSGTKSYSLADKNVIEVVADLKTFSPYPSVARNYDLRSISPNEIDQYVKDLQEIGHPMDRDLGHLATHGAEFLSHLPGNYYAEDNLNEKMDLMAYVDESLAIARSKGEPISGWASQQVFLQKMDLFSHAMPNADGLTPRFTNGDMGRSFLNLQEV